MSILNTSVLQNTYSRKPIPSSAIDRDTRGKIEKVIKRIHEEARDTLSDKIRVATSELRTRFSIKSGLSRQEITNKELCLDLFLKGAKQCKKVRHADINVLFAAVRYLKKELNQPVVDDTDTKTSTETTKSSTRRQAVSVGATVIATAGAAMALLPSVGALDPLKDKTNTTCKMDIPTNCSANDVYDEEWDREWEKRIDNLLTVIPNLCQLSNKIMGTCSPEDRDPKTASSLNGLYLDPYFSAARDFRDELGRKRFNELSNAYFDIDRIYSHSCLLEAQQDAVAIGTFGYIDSIKDPSTSSCPEPVTFLNKIFDLHPAFYILFFSGTALGCCLLYCFFDCCVAAPPQRPTVNQRPATPHVVVEMTTPELAQPKEPATRL